MKTLNWKALFLGVGALAISVLPVQAKQIKESYHPTVNGSPVTLIKDNALTQALGGRVIDMDVWLGEFVKFDDNIFNTRTDKKNDTIFSTAAGMLVQGQQKDVWAFRVEGQLQRNDYAEHRDYNGFEGFIHSQGSVDFSPALSARAMLNYDNTYDNIRNVEEIYGMQKLLAGTGISVRPSPFFGMDLDYSYFTQHRFDDAVKNQEYDEHSIALRPSYALSPNTVVYLQLNTAFTAPVKEKAMNKATQYGGMAGIAWTYKDTAKIIAEVGYKHMQFDDNAKMNVKDDTEQYGSVTGHLRGEYSFTTDWTTGVDVSYAPTYSGVSSSASGSNYLKRVMTSAFLTYSPGEGRFTASLKPYYLHNTPSENDAWAEYGVNVGVTYVVTEWFNVNAGYTLSATDYENEDAYARNAVTLGMALTF